MASSSIIPKTLRHSCYWSKGGENLAFSGNQGEAPGMVLIIEKALNGNQHLLARAQGRVQPWQDSTPKSLQDA
jgi:hypothetical protein